MKTKNKKGQFYFLAVIALASVFVGLVTLRNSSSYPHVSNIVNEKDEINTEISYLFDYFSNEQVSNQNEILGNFSNNYIQKLGKNKDILFMFGNGTSLELFANKLNSTSLLIDNGSGDEEVTDYGAFNKSYTLSNSTFNVTLDGNLYLFKFYEGQNLYYLMKYDYNNQTFVIKG